MMMQITSETLGQAMACLETPAKPSKAPAQHTAVDPAVLEFLQNRISEIKREGESSRARAIDELFSQNSIDGDVVPDHELNALLTLMAFELKSDDGYSRSIFQRLNSSYYFFQRYSEALRAYHKEKINGDAGGQE